MGHGTPSKLRAARVGWLALALLAAFVPASTAAERPALDWVADLAAPAQGDRTRATIAINKMRPVPAAVLEGVTALLGHESWSVRNQALMVLGNMGAEASRALPAIHARLDDENLHVRRSAAGALARVPAQSRAMRLALVAALDTDDDYRRGRVRAALLAVAGDAGDVAPELAALIAHQDRAVRDAALASLAELPPDSVVPILVPFLQGPDEESRNGATRVLTALGPEAAPAVPALVELLSQPGQVYPAMQVLTAIGPAAAPAVPRLVAMLDSPTTPRETRIRATRALRATGSAASTALPRFRAELGRQDLSEASGGYRAALAGAILELSGPGDPAVTAYVERLAQAQRGWRAETRVEAVRALVALGPVALPAMPALRESLLRDRHAKIRGLAADALGAIGPPAHDALPDLRRARSDADAGVRRKVEAAIVEIDVFTELPESGPVVPPAKAAPAPEFAAEPSIEADIAALSTSGHRSSQAAERLLRRGESSLEPLHHAVRAPNTSTRERFNIIALLAELGDPRSVGVVIEVATTHEPALIRDVLRALGSMPPGPQSFAFLERVLSDPGTSARNRGQALVALVLQRELRGASWAARHREAADVELRAAALFLAASLGDATALEPVTALIAAQPGASFRYSMLLALAELADPTDFEVRAAPARAFEHEYDSAHRIARFRSGDAAVRADLFRPMLMSRFPHERRLAVRDLLARGQLAELDSLLEEWQHVAPRVRVTVAAELHRAGYRIAERDRRLVVERRSS